MVELPHARVRRHSKGHDGFVYPGPTHCDVLCLSAHADPSPQHGASPRTGGYARSQQLNFEEDPDFTRHCPVLHCPDAHFSRILVDTTSRAGLRVFFSPGTAMADELITPIVQILILSSSYPHGVYSIQTVHSVKEHMHKVQIM